MLSSIADYSPFVPSETRNNLDCEGSTVATFTEGESDCERLTTIVEEKLATFLRIRPLENVSIEETPYKILNSNLLSVEFEEKASVYNTLKTSKSKNTKFYNFTEIFDGSTNQSIVFNKCCSPLVTDVLNGTSGLLFCFGTTSSGKSYTMRGPHDDPTCDPGLIPLALKKIFSARKFIDTPVIGKTKFCDINLLDEEQQDFERQFKDAILSSACCRSVVTSKAAESRSTFNEDGYQYLCYVSYFEIYNNLVFDLLNSSIGRGQPLSLICDEKSRYFVKDLKSILVSSLSEALKIYSYGWTNLVRNIQQTGLNDNSSRSHSFFSITVIKFKEDAGNLLESQVSHLTLGDLAGSERQGKTQSKGVRVKEGGNINVSLMHLKECFNQTKLSQKNPNRNFVIPFRNSNLTKFFQPYLTGIGRVWMIVNINPNPALFHETCGSLDLCETASHISVNSTFQMKIEESKRRMTQMWLQSSQRWSSFAGKYKICENPAIVIGDETAKENEDTLTMDREDEIRKEVIQQFEEILSDLAKDHEKDIQLVRDNYEKTMEARLALSESKYQALLSDTQEKNNQLATELFDARETIVRLEEEISNMRSQSEKEAEIQVEAQVQTEVRTTVQTEVQTEFEVEVEVEDEVDIKAEALIESEPVQPPVERIEIEVQTEEHLIPKVELDELRESHENLKKDHDEKKTELERLHHEMSDARAAAEKELHELKETLEALREKLTKPSNQTDDQEIQTEEKLFTEKDYEELKESYEQRLQANSDIHEMFLDELRQELIDTRTAAEKETEMKLQALCEELVKPNVETSVKEIQTEEEVIMLKEHEELIEKLRDEMTKPEVITSHQDCQTEEYQYPEIEKLQSLLAEAEATLSTKNTEYDILKETYDHKLIELKELKERKQFQEKVLAKSEEVTERKVSDDAKVVPGERFVAESHPLEEVFDDPVTVASPRKTRKTFGSSCSELRSARKATKDPEKAFSVKKAREITIDTNYLPASVSELTKKKKKEDTVASPSTELAQEYLSYMRKFNPPSAAKKSVKKSAIKRQPRKSTKSSIIVEPEPEQEEEEEEEEGVEDDEIASLLMSKKKDRKKKNNKEEESAVKIPTKRKKLPVTDAFLETSISPHFEDEPAEPNVKGGRVLRPRRKIKF